MLLICTLLLTLTACERNVTDIRAYERYAEDDRYLPSLDELGEYTSVQALYHHDSALFFFWDAYHLIVSYDEPQYVQEKAALEQRYTFREKVIDGDEVGFVPTQPYCDLNGYHVRMLETEGYGFPKDVYFIGSNDEERKIIYTRFFDSDLDSVDSLESFLMNECGWSVLIEKNMLQLKTPFHSEGRWCMRLYE